MAEERTTIHRTPAGDTVETRTTGERGGSGAGWFIALLILAALVIGFFVLMRTSSHEAVKDEAVADAARDVGDAARDVGQAAGAVSADVVDDAQASADRAAEAATNAAENAGAAADRAADSAAAAADKAVEAVGGEPR